MTLKLRKIRKKINFFLVLHLILIINTEEYLFEKPEKLHSVLMYYMMEKAVTEINILLYFFIFNLYF